jgi:type I restriction enzyme S subunit
VPGLSRSQVYSNFILVPNKELLQTFDDIIDPMFKQIENLQEQNVQLRQIRDRLLPRLISGKLKIKAETEVVTCP